MCDIAQYNNQMAAGAIDKEGVGLLEELIKLEAWIEAHIELAQNSLEKKLFTHHQKERIKNQIIGMDKVLVKIRQMKLGRGQD